MAKRFIDTGFFKDPFVRGLQGAYKGLYIYLFCDCSNGGIWNVELDVARLRCGIPDSETDEKIKKIFSEKILEIDDGEKWFLKNFVKVQHNGVLKRNNRAHTSAIEELLKFNLIEEFSEGEFSVKNENKGLIRGLQDPIVKVKEQGNGNGNSKGNGNGKKSEIVFSTKDFKKILIDLGADKIHVNDWLKVRDSKKASNTQTALTTFVNECNAHNYPVSEAVKNCAENSWSGFRYKWIENLNKNINGNRSNNIQRTDAELKRDASISVDLLLGKQ